MAYKKPEKAQKTFEKPTQKNEASGSGIRATKSWINAKGKAVYVNIAEEDLLVKDGRVAFITSLSNLRRMLDGEIGGVNLGQFEDDGE